MLPRMDDNAGPRTDGTTMASSSSESNDEGSKPAQQPNTDNATTSTYSTVESDQPAEYCGQESTRAGLTSPLPAAITATASSSSSTSSSSSSSSSSSPSSFSSSSSSSSSSASSSSSSPLSSSSTTSSPLSSSASTPLPPPPPPQPGCGCDAATVLELDEITISITPTTGGQFDLTVDRADTVENLKKIISKRLKVAKERICLLHRERQLRDGTLEENRLQDGSRLTLLPSVETGLLGQRPEQSVMQALESLNDSQVNDFLSGKAPLNLTMRLGDHMMLIQLQLSTVTPASPTTNQSTGGTPGLTIGNSANGSNLSTSHVSTSLQSRRSTVLAARSSSGASAKLQNGNAASRSSSLISRMASALHAVASCSTSLSTATTTTSPVCSSRASPTSPSSASSSSSSSSVSPSPSYSPISLPHSSFCASQSVRSGNHGSVSPNGNSSNGCQSRLLYHHHHHHHHSHHHHHHHHHYRHHSRNKSTGSSSAGQSSSTVDHVQQSTSTGHGCTESAIPYDAMPPRKKLCTAHHHGQQSASNVDSSSTSSSSRSSHVDRDAGPQSPALPEQNTKAATLDTRALAEASRNLTQKLKQLSSEENARRRQGAIIESMHHHGKGVYSGTFSGTLNPALQDRHGRPKRDISTIIHILNDLLCATPAATASHYRHHHRHSNGRQQPSASPSSAGATTIVNGASTSIACHDSSAATGYCTEELSKENEATKGKMRRLRLVMEQRRAKRKARRQAAAPYTTQWAAVTPDPDPNHDPNTPTAATANSTEPQNEPELQPCSPEPVVA